MKRPRPKDGGPAPQTVRKRPIDYLTHGHAEQEQRDDELVVVGARHAEIGADLRERGQHGVDRKRHQRHHEPHEGDELDKANARAGMA